MAAHKRLESETFEQYRNNLENEAHSLKMYLRGRMFHDSSTGTYVRKKVK
jgi:hypothetical protein